MAKFLAYFLLLIFHLVFIVETDGLAQQPDLSKQSRLRWYKGNTHTHTINSDGDSTPDEVVRWYRERGYNFLVLTDHDFVTNTDGLNSLHGADGKFVVIRGEEVSDKFNGTQIHVNALNINRQIQPQGGKSVVEILQRNVDAVRAAGGVPQINHPNFEWALTAEDLKAVKNYRLFEIYSGHPLINHLGGNGKPGLEEIWDNILSSGALLYGIASDDAHHLKDPWNRYSARPGQGWIVVRAAELAPAAIFEAVEKGDFYASTGVELNDYQVDEKQITINIREQRTSGYRIQFIGKNGRLLSEVTTNPAIYQFRGDEGYVRGKIIESNGKLAWTQPVMIGRR